MTVKQSEKVEHTYIQWTLAILVNFIIFTNGVQSGWMSPMARLLQSEESPSGAPISSITMSWIASTMCMTAVISTPLFSYLTDKIGRKKSILAIIVPQTLCWVIKLISPSVPSLIIARAFCGIAAGGCFAVIPLYIKEISQDNIRGILGSLVMLFQNFGVFVSYAIGAYLGYYAVIWIVVAIPIINGLLLLKLPESPSYLIKTGKNEEATATVALLRGLEKDDKRVIQEVSQMQKQDDYYKSLPKLSYRSILSDKACRRGMLIIIVMITVQAAGGNFAIITFASIIMTTSGVTVSPELQSLSFPLVMLFGSLASLNCVERFGRKPLSVICMTLAAIFLAVLASVILVQSWGTAVPGWVPVVVIVMAVFVYGTGVQPIPYVVMSELFSFQVRARLIGIIVTYAWFSAFVQLVVFAPISNALGMHTMFFIFAAINISGAVANLIYLPETKGKGVEEIALLLRGKEKEDQRDK